MTRSLALLLAVTVIGCGQVSNETRREFGASQNAKVRPAAMGTGRVAYHLASAEAKVAP